MPTERARIHLDVLEQNVLVEADVETGPVRPGALLGLVRELSRASVDAARMKAMLAGKPMTCVAGCAHCCRQLVMVTPIEALSLAALVDALPPDDQTKVRERFAEAARTWATLTEPLDSDEPVGASKKWFAAKVACPFLEDERCSIYADRPIACREWNVSSAAALCATGSQKIEPLQRPLATFQGLLELGTHFGTAPKQGIPLPLALEWASTHADTLGAEHDAETMFHKLTQRMQAAQD